MGAFVQPHHSEAGNVVENVVVAEVVAAGANGVSAGAVEQFLYTDEHLETVNPMQSLVAEIPRAFGDEAFAELMCH
jgi:hypothetical protein